MDIKPSYMSQKVFDNNLVPIRKSKITLTLNKPAYVGMFNLFMYNVKWRNILYKSCGVNTIMFGHFTTLCMKGLN